MSEMKPFCVYEREVMSYNVDGEPWFRGKDVATILECSDTQKAISYHVSEEDQNKMEELKGACISLGP